MYCWTYVNEFTCIFNELQLWTHISSDHPNFLKTVAALSKIELPKDVIDNLDNIHKTFSGLYNRAVILKKSANANSNMYLRYVMDIKRLIDEFIINDTRVISFYPQLMAYGKENKSWMELVKHIIDEQRFMLELFKDLRQQIR